MCMAFKYPKATLHLRILISHLQLLSLVAQVDFHWPRRIQDLFYVFYTIGQTSSYAIHSECIYKYLNMFPSVRNSYYETIIYAFLPLINILPIAIVFVIIEHSQKVKKR